MADILNLAEFSETRSEIGAAVSQCAPYIPLYVKIKLTWLCNLRCAMCNVWRVRKKSQLTFPVLQGVAADLAELGTRKIHLSGGEVLLLPNIIEIIDLFAGYGMQVNLTTNGTLLTQEMADRLVASGVHNISISLDGATRAGHDRLRGQDNWKRTTRGIRTLRRAAKHARRKLHIRVNTVITRHNYLDLAALPETIHQLGADRLTLIPVDDPGDQLRLNKIRINHFNAEVAPYLGEIALALGLISQVAEAYPFGTRSEEIEQSKRGNYALGFYRQQPCYVPWLHALITPRGRVYPCCMLRSSPPIGNIITDGGFREVWTGAAYGQFRRQMLLPGQQPALCLACDDFIETNKYLHELLQPAQAPR